MHRYGVAAGDEGDLRGMSAERFGCRECVMNDGRFAVLGGFSLVSGSISACEALVVGDAAHWEPLPPMHDARSYFVCETVAGCPIVAGGLRLKSAELYDAELNRWLRLPCDLPFLGGFSLFGGRFGALAYMGSAVL